MTQRRTREILLSDALDMFLLDCAARRLTEGTLQFYKSKLAVFFHWCGDHNINALAEVTAHDIRRFLVDIHRRKLSSQYQNNLARAIRAFFNYCVRDELIETSPFKKVQMPRLEKKIISALSPKDIKTILQNCGCERDRSLCLFLLDSGVRASELAALNIGDIDLQSGVVQVHSGKGQKGRTTYIGARTRKQLKRYWAERSDLNPKRPAFIAIFSGERLTVHGLVQLMARLSAKSGVLGCTCHTFRRTFAISCLRNGMNIYVLARLMGHADILILKQYLAFVDEDLKGAHERFGAVDNLLA
ncbi:MAG: tyrosine-type recombinase/integrase [Caldilineaceae bacterium]|nr:tyrosine-type recombinase/integrase [Caldilineaceae bacterium]